MLPDFERADRMGEFWSYPQSRALAELLIDCEEDRTLRAVLVGMLRETPRRADRPVLAQVGSLVVAAWLAGIVVNLLTFDPPRYYDIAARDFALVLAALTLNRLATAFGATTVAAEARHLKAAA